MLFATARRPVLEYLRVFQSKLNPQQNESKLLIVCQVKRIVVYHLEKYQSSPGRVKFGMQKLMQFDKIRRHLYINNITLRD